MDTQLLKSSKILLIGELCVDRYLFGTTDRIRQEAPVPIFKSSGWTDKEGMGGNVKSNLESLGNDVHFVHNDEPIRKTRVIDSKHNQQLLRLDREDTPLRAYDFSFLPDVKGYDAVVVSDYNKGIQPLNVLYDISHEAYLQDVPMFIDTKKSYLDGIKGCFVKLNEHEYKNLKSPIKENHYIVTLGSKGASYRSKTYEGIEVPLADPTGAGDTFIAAFTSAYLSCGDIPRAIDFANLCAAISVCKLGCHVVTMDSIDEYYDNLKE